MPHRHRRSSHTYIRGVLRYLLLELLVIDLTVHVQRAIQNAWGRKKL